MKLQPSALVRVWKCGIAVNNRGITDYRQQMRCATMRKAKDIILLYDKNFIVRD